MLLFNGVVIDAQETDGFIAEMHTRIPMTLSSAPLDRNIVLDAAKRLLEEYSAGHLQDELKAYLSETELNLFNLKEVISKFDRKALNDRVTRELGHLYKNPHIIVAPKGVLLHIAAGNLDVLPAYSVLEGLLTGNINILKLPSSDKGLSIFLLRKLIDFQPLLKDYIYVFDTPSSDVMTIQKLMEISNALVVWGSDESILALRRNAPVNTEIIEWGHKLSFCYLKETDISDARLALLASHFLETNQLLCNACQGVFVNTDDMEIVRTLAERLAFALKEQEDQYPLPDYLQGKLTVNLLTKRLETLNEQENIYINQRSSVTCKPDSVLELSELYGSIWVKPLPADHIHQALFWNKTHLQTVVLSSYDPDLIGKFTQLGCTQICSIELLEGIAFRQTHDGKYALNHYVRLVEIA